MSLAKIIKDGTENGGSAADKINAGFSAIDAGIIEMQKATDRIDSLDKFKGTFHSLAELQTAHPTGKTGDYAYIDTGTTDLEAYAWSEGNTAWESTGGSASGLSPADQAKLNHIALAKDIDLNKVHDTTSMMELVLGGSGSPVPTHISLWTPLWAGMPQVISPDIEQNKLSDELITVGNVYKVLLIKYR